MKANSIPAAVVLILFFPLIIFSQNDSLTIAEVNVSVLPGKRPMLRIPASIEVVDSARLDLLRSQSLLPVLNSVAGVRMEERSPGSYRLSIRGSVLRSPFGIRNLKVYMDEMPLTNAGGETYLNLIDQWAIKGIEIHKGPDGSVFGANSGGVMRIGFFDENGHPSIQIESTAGSFNLYRGSIRFDDRAGKHRFFFTTAYDHNGGYREHSGLDRFFIQAGENWNYNSKSSLKVMVLGSALQYQTPGGLTASQQMMDPRSARPRTRSMPGAADQQAGIGNNTFIGAVTHNLRLRNSWEHMLCVFGSVTDFKNPFITNYEIREEKNFGFRTWLRYQTKGRIRQEFIIGAEQQYMFTEISNSFNAGGSPGTLIGSDNTDISQGFVFARIGIDFLNLLLVEGSISLNQNKLNNHNEQSGINSVTDLEGQIMPRLAISSLVADGVTLRALVSKGYSAPSLQELRPAAAVFNTSLQPEDGWNYECGARWLSPKLKYRADLTGFVYRLNDAIVRQVDQSGNEYFQNAGGTSQAGVELQASGVLLKKETGFFRGLDVLAAATWYRFTFVNYFSGTDDFSGNKLTGVPEKVYNGTITLRFPFRLFLCIQDLYVSGLPLNDENSTWAPQYNLLQVKGGWVVRQSRPFLQLSLACDNVLNQLYSSGHDLNAFGGRFYNPSPGRNYFAQLIMKI